MSIENTTSPPQISFDTPAQLRLRKLRKLKDKMAGVGIAFGGISVILAILLIFFYLLYEVAPLFQSAHMEKWQHNGQTVENYASPGEGKTLYLAMEEQAEIGLRITATHAYFFNTLNGDIINESALPVPEGVEVVSTAVISEPQRLFALGLSNGSALIIKHDYRSTYPDGVRVITPSLEYPLGEEPLSVSDRPLALLGIAYSGDSWNIIGGDDKGLSQVSVAVEENMMTGEVELESESSTLPAFNIGARKLLLLPDNRWLMIAGKNKIAVVDLQADGGPQTVQVAEATKGEITTFKMLLGGNALLVGDNQGHISQWFLVRDEATDWVLTKIRSFESGSAAIDDIAIEQRRKGFAAINNDGTLRLYNTTAHRNALTDKVADGRVDYIAYAPRSNAMLIEQNSTLAFWAIENEHPDISWSALWEKVWYEGYEEPDYVWQSSAANNDFEPKYSLMPLAFGTLKAAFYAMLLGTPLAICGAIYTAYFMVPAMRRKVKPFIELMEALPTVILGFLAGLWLAPFMELHLAGIFVILILVPISIVLFGFIWAQVPDRIRFLIPEGWDAALLVPVIILTVMLSLSISVPVEELLFGGDLRLWISNEAGIPFDQRNALVVGIAMGFAVIPTIFSITEDAIFAVPKHLSYGSLALGATPWQTLTRVILPTASPGIFSALMIGMGRAVGETMIVLMATGNTPIMDMNIFEGMRTLAANIAVEMPESEVGSTHFRILFLAAFVLFLFTFMVNTLAELVRQRLRKKYGSL
ncbi:ABC transporter permease subunit [Neptunomonas sp. CHC150]|jgi:phosphate transport system permease protein|uniref:ABC transporter permease subunit n=1 Tax=Neptunomonas TaxID=75687 RepID=UPI0025AFA41D|nr:MULTISPECIES: ABC transporter permease subunit [Neptunomonas]MDN2660270.1 ABC transporter permease subunit [Neptunomonas sp. CHC150]MDO6469398.1 ABC transporter permease subunit [Neptunomonas phycophila]